MVKISWQTGQGSMTMKEADWSVEECASHGGHCWVRYTETSWASAGNGSGGPKTTRTCTHCGYMETLKITPAVEEWEAPSAVSAPKH